MFRYFSSSGVSSNSELAKFCCWQSVKSNILLSQNAGNAISETLDVQNCLGGACPFSKILDPPLDCNSLFQAEVLSSHLSQSSQSSYIERERGLASILHYIKCPRGTFNRNFSQVNTSSTEHWRLSMRRGRTLGMGQLGPTPTWTFYLILNNTSRL